MRKIKKRIIIFIITVLVLASFVFTGIVVAFDGNDYIDNGDYGGFDYGSPDDGSLDIGITYIFGLIAFVIFYIQHKKGYKEWKAIPLFERGLRYGFVFA